MIESPADLKCCDKLGIQLIYVVPSVSIRAIAVIDRSMRCKGVSNLYFRRARGPSLSPCMTCQASLFKFGEIDSMRASVGLCSTQRRCPPGSIVVVSDRFKASHAVYLGANSLAATTLKCSLVESGERSSGYILRRRTRFSKTGPGSSFRMTSMKRRT